MMKKLLAVGLILLPCVASAFFFTPGGSSGGGSGTTNASDLSSGTLPAARIGDNSVTAAKLKADSGTAGATTYFRGNNTWGTPTGSGTVTGPATATQDNLACWGADNVTIKDCGKATSAFAPSSSTSTATDWNKWDGGATGLTAATGRTSLGLAGMAVIDNGTLTNTKTCIYTAGVGIVCNTTPAGSGTVTGPAVATADNVTTWGADNTTIKDGGVALSALARLASPTFTGVPAAPTAAADTNTTQVATTAYVIGQGYAKLVSPSFTTPTLGVATATTLNTGQGAYELYKMDQNVSTDASPTFVAVTAGSFVSNGADNTHYGNVKNTSSPTTTNLAAGNYWTLPDEALRLRNQDNSATNVLASATKYYRLNIDAPTAADNVVFDGPLPFAQVWDNVLIIVQDNTGKLSGTAADNVTVNLSYCSSIATPTCTNVFTTNQTATGAAILTPTLNNTTPAAADYIRVTVSAANMVNKKVYIRARYFER